MATPLIRPASAPGPDESRKPGSTTAETGTGTTRTDAGPTEETDRDVAAKEAGSGEQPPVSKPPTGQETGVGDTAGSGTGESDVPIDFGAGDVADDDGQDDTDDHPVDGSEVINDGWTGEADPGPPTTIDFGIGAPSAVRLAADAVPEPIQEQRAVEVPRLDLEPEELPGEPGLPSSNDPDAHDVLFDRVSSIDTDDLGLDDDPIDDRGDLQVLLDAFE